MCELLVPGAFSLSTTTVNTHIHSSFTSVVIVDSCKDTIANTDDLATAWASVAATFCRATVHHETSYGIQVLGLHALSGNA